MPAKLEYPFTLNKIRKLKVGQTVSICGKIFTARDRLHKYLHEGGKSPVSLADGAIYHCGPVVIRKGGNWFVCAAGPTTSFRQDQYMPRIIEQHRVRVIIGKGGMDNGTRTACRQSGCIYLQAVGGAASLVAQNVTAVSGVYFLREFGQADAMWELAVRGLKAVVTIDSKGQSLHRRVKASSKRALTRLLRQGQGVK